MTTIINKDVIIFGGGIAGLWLLNRLRSEGYDAILFEHETLGNGQSVASQGMIHGGMKYALAGKLNSASNAIADMPAHWKACLKGKGDVDLRGTKLLSEQYYMWPANSMRSRFNAFLGSKAVRGKVDTVDQNKYPSFFQGKISGPLYQLNDIVLDVPSLLQTLAENQRQHIHLIDWQQSTLEKTDDGSIKNLTINKGSNNTHDKVEIHAQRYLFTCGAGTTEVLNKFNLSPLSFAPLSLAPKETERKAIAPFDMQLRPLQMVMVKHDLTHPVYVHCVSDQLTSTPELTITSHPCADGKWVWYLGGELAEAGVDRTKEEQIEAAKHKLAQLFPWCKFDNAQWKTLFISRAEAKQSNGKRPEQASIVSHQNILVCWPTKLTLAPSLGNEVMAKLKLNSISPGSYKNNASLKHLPFPKVSPCPWDSIPS